jgi:hypothetical protein
MNRSLILSFVIAALAGAAVWALSPLMTGHSEPWDAGGIYYAAALALAGFLSGVVARKPLWALYVGSFCGQLSYALLFLPSGPLMVVGLFFLLAWSLLFLGGAYAGSRIRSRLGSRPAAA